MQPSIDAGGPSAFANTCSVLPDGNEMESSKTALANFYSCVPDVSEEYLVLVFFRPACRVDQVPLKFYLFLSPLGREI